MESFTAFVYTLFSLAWQIFALFFQLIVYILSFFLIIAQSILRLFTGG